MNSCVGVVSPKGRLTQPTRGKNGKIPTPLAANFCTTGAFSDKNQYACFTQDSNPEGAGSSTNLPSFRQHQKSPDGWERHCISPSCCCDEDDDDETEELFQPSAIPRHFREWQGRRTKARAGALGFWSRIRINPSGKVRSIFLLIRLGAFSRRSEFT